jgi:hypothetical protein
MPAGLANSAAAVADDYPAPKKATTALNPSAQESDEMMPYAEQPLLKWWVLWASGQRAPAAAASDVRSRSV